MQLPSSTMFQIKKHSTKTLLLCSRIFDSESASFVSDQTIEVDEITGLISDVRGTTLADARAENMVDLRNTTVLPGFVDSHSHFFVHSVAEASELDQMILESIGERTIRAVTHAKATLLAGYTTIRDLGTEGAEDADIAVRKCISKPLSLIPGPRYFVCTRAIANTGAYGPKTDLHPSKTGVDDVSGVDVADGIDGCRRVVRKQVGAGTDWIKLYVDNRPRGRLGSSSKILAGADLPLWSPEELKAIIDTAHALGVKVCGHTTLPNAIKTVCALGIDTIEHGYNADLSALEAMRDAGVIFVPTLAAFHAFSELGRWPLAKKVFEMALKVEGLKIAAGGDTGVFPHGRNALEMQTMMDNGMHWKRALQAGTYMGWLATRNVYWDGEAGKERLTELIAMGSEAATVGDNDVPFGIIKKGFAADIIATSGDLERDARDAVTAEKIVFVMKGGQVYKAGGRALV